jgi:tetratricopeptide (TPR) repeat protein
MPIETRRPVQTYLDQKFLRRIARRRTTAGSYLTGLVLSMLLANRCLAARQNIQLRDAVRDPGYSKLEQLPLDPVVREHLTQAIQSRDYPQAERILIDAIQQHPKNPQLLTFLGGIYFLDGNYLECAVAMKKAEALAPLLEADRFTLAMAYIVLNHSDWAQPELESLAHADPNNALVVYWLSRIDYFGYRYRRAAAEARQAVHLNPMFMRAYDDLGLCEEGLGNYSQALDAYREAIKLDRARAAPSPWPPLDLGALLLKLNRLEDADSAIREALRDDPTFPEGHYRLGLLLQKQGKQGEAIQEFERAATLNPSYAEPHYALGRIYQEMGSLQKAKAEFSLFDKLKQAQQRQPLR